MQSFGSGAALSENQVMSVHELALCQPSWTRGDDLAKLARVLKLARLVAASPPRQIAWQSHEGCLRHQSLSDEKANTSLPLWFACTQNLGGCDDLLENSDCRDDTRIVSLLVKAFRGD